MQHGIHNQFPISVQRTRQGFAHGFIALLLCFSLLSPSPVQAVPMGVLKGLASFKLMIVTIANINFAMKQAAENPQDAWRRQNVQHAMGMLPGALMALAADFKKAQLHDKDLPMVQAILGGFVDQSFVGKYQAFMKNPTKDKIPKTGAGFPAEALQQAEKSYIRMDENRDGNAPAVAVDSGEKGEGRNSISASQLANLDPSGAIFGNASRKNERPGKADNASIRMNEDAKGTDDQSNSPSARILGDSKESGNRGTLSPSFAEEISKEINSVEQRLSGGMIRGPASREDKVNAEDEAFFKTKPKKELPKSDDARRKSIKKRPLADKTSFFRIHRQLPVVMLLQSLLSIEAQAAGCQDGECGGEGEEGGGSGSKAAEILQALAMMMMAAAPMVAAAIQADADKTIAKINAATQVTLTKMTAETSRYMADNQRQLAEFQANVTAKMSDEKNKKDITSLNMQLAEIKSARDQARQSEREKRALEDKYNQDRIALAQRQADDNLKVAKQTLNAQLTQAGLSTGFKNTRDSSSRLSVDRVAGTGSANPYAVAGTGGRTGTAGLPSGATQAGGGQAVGFMAAQGKLMASLKNPNQGMQIDPRTGAQIKGSTIYGAKATRGLASASVKRGLVANLKLRDNGVAMLARGSTRGFRQVIPGFNRSSGDVTQFLLAAANPSPSYAGYENLRRAAIFPETAGSARPAGFRGVAVENRRAIRSVSPEYAESGGQNGSSSHRRK